MAAEDSEKERNPVERQRRAVNKEEEARSNLATN